MTHILSPARLNLQGVKFNVKMLLEMNKCGAPKVKITMARWLYCRGNQVRGNQGQPHVGQTLELVMLLAHGQVDGGSLQPRPLT